MPYIPAFDKRARGAHESYLSDRQRGSVIGSLLERAQPWRVRSLQRALASIIRLSIIRLHVAHVCERADTLKGLGENRCISMYAELNPTARSTSARHAARTKTTQLRNVVNTCSVQSSIKSTDTFDHK
ncbi:hypothetical protein EVAR_35919_1 [Eumeta japonica]|uniref:Uncharacterized protein n=1 Tax=Eumeta variegata TaxID=151549 RepID=A0A4C1W563_EUMVA|nr:hypothetical protein EVAR_35919_1 [Eumeta japonica]